MHLSDFHSSFARVNETVERMAAYWINIGHGQIVWFVSDRRKSPTTWRKLAESIDYLFSHGNAHLLTSHENAHLLTST